MGSVEVMDKYATFISDDETSKTSNTFSKNSLKYEVASAEDALMVISEVSETPIVYESPYHQPASQYNYNNHHDQNQYGNKKKNVDRQKMIVEGLAESEGFCSADDEQSFEPKINKNNRQSRHRKYMNSRVSSHQQPDLVTSDDDTSTLQSESFEVISIDNSPKHHNRSSNNKNNNSNKTLILFQNLVGEICGNQLDVKDDNSILRCTNSSSFDSILNSDYDDDDESSIRSAFGCHDLDFSEEIRAEIIDARIAFNRLVEYVRVRLRINAAGNSYGHNNKKTSKANKKRKHMKRRRPRS